MQRLDSWLQLIIAAAACPKDQTSPDEMPLCLHTPLEHLYEVVV